MEITSGFLVVKRFEALYRAFALLPKFDRAIYALPVQGTGPERLSIRYRGLDRDALSPHDWGLLAEARMKELKARFPYGTLDSFGCFLTTHDEAMDVLRWADEEEPGVYEVIWTHVAGAPVDPPPACFPLGFEPTYSEGGTFSAVCDCMCFPRWHGTDPEGTLFKEHFDRLNGHGLFDEPRFAEEFLFYYLSFDWTETGDYVIAEVWAPEGRGV